MSAISPRPQLDIADLPYGELLRNAATREPEHPAVVWGSRAITFRELESLSNSLANALRGLALRKGERLALFMANRPEYVIAFFAAAKLGLVATPLNPSYREHEARYQLGDSGAAAAIVDRDTLGVVLALRAELPELRHVICCDGATQARAADFWALVRSASPAPPPPPPLDPGRELVALPYSSGTTGLPKGVMLTHRNLVANNIQSRSAQRITARDRLLVFLPLYHIYGTMLMGVAVAAGATQVLMERFDPSAALAAAATHRVTLIHAVPPALLAFLQSSELTRTDLSSVRYIVCGAAPLPPEVARRMEAASGIRVVQGYGLTEASPLTHLNPVDDPADARPETVGIGVSNQEDRIVDLETGARPLGTEEVGELIVRGPHVMQGYWHAPQETARTLRDGWLYTGDIARRDADGFVTILDRKKEMIKYKGFAVAPAELEAVLFQHPAVADCAVVPRPDPEAGEVPRAYVVARPGSGVTAQELLAFVAAKLAGYKRIREVRFVAEIPKNPSGKILRRVLKERAAERDGPR